jgi:hypothetical protein
MLAIEQVRGPELLGHICGLHLQKSVDPWLCNKGETPEQGGEGEDVRCPDSLWKRGHAVVVS